MTPQETPRDRSLVALLLTSHLVPQTVKPLRSSEFWSLLSRFEELESLVSEPPDAIEHLLSTSTEQARQIHELLGGAASFAFELETLQRRGITVLSALDEGYPAALRERLGSAAPPVLYVAGPLELAVSSGIGIVGARDVDPDAARAAKDAATLLASNGLTVYSGAAKGIDQVAMNAAFAAGGKVVGILADSLERRLRDPDTRRAIMDDRVCLFTPYKPSMGFTVANAMARNKLIYALARRTFVVQSDFERGGTWAGASEWLKRTPQDVAVWVGRGKGPGNDALVAAGAQPIDRLDQLMDLDDTEPATATTRPHQLGLGM
jgi:predicted Rossmann fold nucleotide-binding protein DprA/Smf involved in DNA uptake